MGNQGRNKVMVLPEPIAADVYNMVTCTLVTKHNNSNERERDNKWLNNIKRHLGLEAPFHVGAAMMITLPWGVVDNLLTV